MHPMLNTAVKAARRAGNIITRATRNLDMVAVREKAANDFVSEVDREAEQAIISTLREAYPGHAILAEESGASGDVRIPLDHRSARRHDQFPPRLSALLRVDRARAPRHRHAGGRLRPGAERSLHGEPRPRRVPERDAHTREQAAASQIEPRRHGLSVQELAHLDAVSRDAARRDERQLRACAARAPPRSISRTSPRDGSTASGRSASRPGTWRRARSSSPKPAGSSATSKATKATWRAARIVAGTPKVFGEMVQAHRPAPHSGAQDPRAGAARA